MNKKGSVYLISDEEFYKMKQDEASKSKESVLDRLLEASNNKSKFSVSSIKPKEDKLSKMNNNSNTTMDFAADQIPNRMDNIISDDEWDNMIDHFDELSPIDDIVDEERYSYRRSEDDLDDYQQLFKKENSMLSDVLSGLQKRSKIVDTKIKSMSGKGTYGVSKNFSDILEAANSLDSTRLSVIKEMINIKKTVADLRLKDKRLTPDNGMNDNDSVADAFYKQIIGGGASNFVQSSLNQYGQAQQGIIRRSTADDIPIMDGINVDEDDGTDSGFNITQPIRKNMETGSNITASDVDPYGYIANEKKNVDICLYKYDDGSSKFVALDEDGEVIPNYELPDESLLETIRIKPNSNYAYDDYDRKYRIIDIETSGVSLDDIDDESYDKITNDDKYDY